MGLRCVRCARCELRYKITPANKSFTIPNITGSFMAKKQKSQAWILVSGYRFEQELAIWLGRYQDEFLFFNCNREYIIRYGRSSRANFLNFLFLHVKLCITILTVVSKNIFCKILKHTRVIFKSPFSNWILQLAKVSILPKILPNCFFCGKRSWSLSFIRVNIS